MPLPAKKVSELALGILYPDGTVSDIECFPDLVTPEEFLEIIEWQVRHGLRTAEEAAEIRERVSRNLVPLTDDIGS